MYHKSRIGTNDETLPSDNHQWQQQGAFTSGGSGSSSSVFYGHTALTGAAGDTNYLSGMILANTITTQNNSETIGDVAQVRLVEPNITIGNDTVTNASTLLITGAPTEGANNYAILVDSGVCGFGGAITPVSADGSAIGSFKHNGFSFIKYKSE